MVSRGARGNRVRWKGIPSQCCVLDTFKSVVIVLIEAGDGGWCGDQVSIV